MDRGFLRERKQRVKLADDVSEWEDVRSGVAQGTVLGPTLFLVYINDLSEELTSTVKIFADDTKVYRCIERKEDCEELQSDISSLQEKGSIWGSEFNEKKCIAMNIGTVIQHFEYHLKNANGEDVPLKNSICERDLGVRVQNNLKVNEQCTTASQKAKVAMRQMKQTFRYITVPLFRTLYGSYVRPHLEFSIQAWSPYLVQDRDKLEKVQRSATKTVRGIRNHSYEERLKTIGIHRLSKRRERGDLIETYKIMNGIENLDREKFFHINPETRTRGGDGKIFIERSRLEVRRNFFSKRVANKWNKLPETTRRSENVTQLKRKIDKDWESDGYGYQE